MIVSMVPVLTSDRGEFLVMAVKHFSDLNPSFVPQEDWKEHYFPTIMANPEYFLRWIVCDGKRAGFILMGLEKHRFLPRKNGAIFDLYVSPEFRGRGVAQAVGRDAIQELWAHSPSKIQIELANGESSWAAFWKSIGFQKTTERFVLGPEKP